jgi:preflagellin peptidase FlaK
VDSAEAINALRLVLSLSILAYASFLDLRTRRVPNIYWIGLGAAGLGLIFVQLFVDEMPIEYLLVFVPILAILADVYLGSEEETIRAKLTTFGKYALALGSILVLAYQYGSDEYFQHLLAIPIFVLLVVVMYMLDIVRGGADAKALISLSILFPFYPVFGTLPFLHGEISAAETLLPFSFSVLVNAAIIVALTPLVFLARNLSRREFAFPLGLLGYKLDTTEIAGRHVWLMESITDGKLVTHARPRRQEDQKADIELLTSSGHKRVWVTPKIPFIIPMFVSLILTAVVGNVLLFIFPI